MNKLLIILLALVLSAGTVFAQAGTRYKAVPFENPGTKRVLKTDAASYYFYRSLPEKTMRVNTTGITKLEVRSFSTEVLRKPEIISIVGKTKTTHTLLLNKVVGTYQAYNSFSIDIPANTKEIELLCYDRTMYMRAFNVLPPKPPKPAKLKNMVLKAHGGAMSVQHNGSSSDYYSLMPSQSLKFSLNNGSDAYIYVRPRLLDRSTPKLGVFVNGDLIQTVEFDLKRTTKYHVTGINNLGIAKKIDLPDNKSSSEIELRALSVHLFLAKPVLLKKK